MVQVQDQVQAKALDQELLQVLELLVQALEQVVRVTALEMEQVREQVLELALAVGLVQVPAEERVLAAVPDLVEVEAQVEVLEPGMAPVLRERVQVQGSAQLLAERSLKLLIPEEVQSSGPLAMCPREPLHWLPQIPLLQEHLQFLYSYKLNFNYTSKITANYYCIFCKYNV
jgi:hypothetical protein